MSVASEITRLQTAKVDLKTAIEAKGVTVPSATTIDGYAALVGQISGGGGDNWNILTLRKTNGITLSASDIAAMVANPYCQGLFERCKMGAGTMTFSGITSFDHHWAFENFMNSASVVSGSVGVVDVSFPDLTSLSTYESCFRSFAANAAPLKSFSFPTLTTVSASSSFQQAVYQSRCETVSFPNLTTVSASACFNNFAYYCSKLTSVDFSSLTTITGNNAFNNAFVGCSALTTFTIHPSALQYSNNKINPLLTATAVTTLTLTADATLDVYLTANTALSSASVLGVLNHLSTSASGKTCAFANLTISSSDTNYSAISAKVAALTNWTITGLTL